MPLLNPLQWDDEALALLAKIQPTDKQQAEIWWRKYAPIYYQAILDSGILDREADLPQTQAEFDAWLDDYYGGAPPEDDYTTEEQRRAWWRLGLVIFFAGGAYLTMQGGGISPRDLDRALIAAVRKAENDMQALWEALRTGAIDLAEWQLQMSELIKTVQIAGAVLQKGGFGRMSPDDWARVEREIANQLAYLLGFARRIAGGIPIDGNVLRVMRMYLWAMRGTFYLFEELQRTAQGATHYENMITATESCRGCLEQSAQGIQPIGTLVPIGERDCLTHCKCYWVYYTIEEGQDESEATPLPA